ncbi:hypothetical protein KQH56_00790 [bacterium]|nr:hypothetical protein [bacterium]
MSDIYERVEGQQDFFKKLLAKIPGFKGYVERGDRRMSDKLLREKVADSFESLYARVSSLQRDLIGQGQIEYVDDLEAAAIKLRQFIDRVRTASYGYSGIFDAIKIRQDELATVYEYDYALLALGDEVSAAVDNVEKSIGTEGLEAAIRHLTSVSQQCVEAFNKRSEVLKGIAAE